jgi:hypothetical protein
MPVFTDSGVLVFTDRELNQLWSDVDHAVWSMLEQKTYQLQVASGNCETEMERAFAAAAELAFAIKHRDAGIGCAEALMRAASDYRDKLLTVAARAHTLASVEQACADHAERAVPGRGSHLQIVGRR